MRPFTQNIYEIITHKDVSVPWLKVLMLTFTEPVNTFANKKYSN